jgi:hypothetical protein
MSRPCSTPQIHPTNPCKIKPSTRDKAMEAKTSYTGERTNGRATDPVVIDDNYIKVAETKYAWNF